MAVIYALECSVNGFAYVGVTNSKLSKRLREHRCLCNNYRHHATKLTEDWHKYGQSAFSMKVLEIADYSHRGSHCEAEQKWIDYYDSLGMLYNGHNRSTGLGAEITRKGVLNAHNEAGNRWTPEANLKRSLAQKGKPKGHGAKISATKQAKKMMMI